MGVFADLHVVVDPLVGDRFYATGNVPADHEYPYVSMIDDVFDGAPALEGDGRAMSWRTFVQLDLWQRTGDESPALLRELRDRVDGLKLSAPYLRARVQSTVRVPEPAPTLIVHHAITVAVAEVAGPITA